MCLAGIAQIVIGATATGVLTTFVSQQLQQKSKTLDVIKGEYKDHGFKQDSVQR
jgi:hypothetical protein